MTAQLGERRAPRVAFLAATLVVGAVLVVLWSPALDLDRGPFLAQVGAFRVQVAAAAVALGAVALLGRRTRACGLVLALVGASVLPQVLPRVIGDGPGGPADLTVLTVNVFLDQASPAAVAAAAVAHRADVVALPEATSTFAAEMAAAAATAGVTYLAATDGPPPPVPANGQRDGPYPTSVLVRAELRPVLRPGVPPVRLGGITAELGLPRPLTVAVVHATAPVPGQEPLWVADHALLAAACAAGRPLVLAGDLNATLDQSPLRDVLAAGCRDAAAQAGAGLAGTWPARAPAPLRVPIDHVLLTPAAGTARGVEVIAVPGTDHRGLLVRIGPPA